jgi:transposase-like protein
MKQRRKYDQQFKDDAVRLLLKGDRTLKAVAESLGVERSCLARWRNKYLQGDRGGGEKPMETGQNASELEKDYSAHRNGPTYAHVNGPRG